MDRTRRLPSDDRVTVDFPATYAAVLSAARNPPPRLTAQVTQLSKTGLRLRTQSRLAIDAWIDIIYQDERRSRIQVQARVVRALPGFKPNFEYGLMIIDDDSARKSTGPEGAP